MKNNLLQFCIFSLSSTVLLFQGVSVVSAEEQMQNVVTTEKKQLVEIEEKQENVPENQMENKTSETLYPDLEGQTSKQLVGLAWESSSKRKQDRLNAVVDQCLAISGKKALEQQNSLTGFPERGDADSYQELNDVGTCLFIQAEFLMNSGKTDESIAAFEKLIETYYWAQAWDPRGWHWSIEEKSRASIDVLTGKVVEDDIDDFVKIQRTVPKLHTKGLDAIVDYTKYGEFQNVGKANFHYKMTDPEGLKAAVGEGIYPNVGAIYKNPNYKKAKRDGRLKNNHWDYVNSDDLEASYFKWATAKEPWGVRMFYVGMAFEKAGMYHEALRAYHALIVHYPKTVGWTYWQTPWYPGQAAIAKIRHIIRMHPELNLEAKWMNIKIQNGYDNIIDNDIIRTYPGKIVQKGFLKRVQETLKMNAKVSLGKVKKKIGEGTVRLVQYENDHWQLLVDDKPYVIKGLTYAPTKIGQSPDKGTLANWMEEDSNKNGIVDGPYEAWVDENKNNIQDPNEKVVGDFQLMKDMGVNTIRFYHDPDVPNKELLREMFKKYGIRVILGDFVGKYTIGSGATWMEGTDYDNPEHKKNMMASVQKMVMEHKDEPYILMWLLGNENNYGVASNADKKPEAYFKFIDEVAVWIKSVDKNHPVSVSNGDTLFLDIFAKNSPNIDIFAANVYRGDYGFGSYWEQVLDATGKPAYITEYGCPAYARHLSLEEAEQAQADYHRGNWMDIEENLAGRARGMGNSIGGVTFQWMDEWWKSYEPFRHDKKSDAIGPFPGGYYFEEWFGLIGQGDGQHSPFMRQLRKSYYVYKELWNKKFF